MPIKTVSSHEFKKDPSGAETAALHGPVFITDRGRPRHVLLSVEDYRRLTGAPRCIVDALAMPDHATIEFHEPRASIVGRPADLD